jgi:hypothetical protein
MLTVLTTSSAIMLYSLLLLSLPYVIDSLTVIQSLLAAISLCVGMDFLCSEFVIGGSRKRLTVRCCACMEIITAIVRCQQENTMQRKETLLGGWIGTICELQPLTNTIPWVSILDHGNSPDASADKGSPSRR